MKVISHSCTADSIAFLRARNETGTGLLQGYGGVTGIFSNPMTDETEGAAGHGYGQKVFPAHQAEVMARNTGHLAIGEAQSCRTCEGVA